MILPTKGITSKKALLSIGALILDDLDESKTVSRLWSNMRNREDASPDLTFDWFVLALDLLHIMGTIEYYNGLIVLIKQNESRETHDSPVV